MEYPFVVGPKAYGISFPPSIPLPVRAAPHYFYSGVIDKR